MNKDMYSTQAEAVRAAREALWGTGSFLKRECLLPEPGTYSIIVSANVNGDLVVFAFDNFGRLDSRQPDGGPKPLVIKRGCR